MAVIALTVASAWMLGRTTAGRVPGFLDLWYRWDVVVFAKIGEFGGELPLLTIAHERFCRAADAGLGLRDDSRVIETWN